MVKKVNLSQTLSREAAVAYAVYVVRRNSLPGLAALAGIIFLVIWFTPWIQQRLANPLHDLAVYQNIGNAVRVLWSGGSSSLESQYPPLASVLFFAISHNPLGVPFGYAWLGFLVLVLGGVSLYASFFLDPIDTYAFTLAALASTLILGPDLVLGRYDLVIAALLYLAWRAYRRERYRDSGLFLMLAGSLKLVPLLLVPLIILATPRRSWQPLLMGLMLGIFVSWTLTLTVLGFNAALFNTTYLISYQGSRGVGIDSTWSGWEMLWSNLVRGFPSTTSYHHYATHNMDLGLGTVAVSLTLLIAGVLTLYYRMLREGEKATDYFELYLFLTLLWILITVPVLSPQYLLWVLPLLGIWCFEKMVRSRTFDWYMLGMLTAIVGVALSSHWLFPIHYEEMIRQTSLITTLVLNLRSVGMLILFGLLALIAFPSRRLLPNTVTVESDPAAGDEASVTPELHRWFRQLLSLAMLLAVLGAILYITSFKVLDRDFWWHITSGRVMLEMKSMIDTDPFAYTRADQPYLANHEWLAQIILYLVQAWSGFTGVIILRSLIIAAIFLILLAINFKNIWFNGLLAIWGATLALPGYMDRPQLFSYLMFTLFLYFALRYLDGRTDHPEAPPDRYRWYIFAFIALQIFWVNLHGAAALLGILIVGALFLQELWDFYYRSQPQHLIVVAILLATVTIALLASPNTYHNLTYFYHLLTDKTVNFIGEWQPRAQGEYAGRLGLLWLAVGASFLLTGRRKLFSLLIVAAVGYLSTRALRHEMFFIFTAVALIIYHLKYSSLGEKVSARLLQKKFVLVPALLVAVFGLALFSRAQYAAFVQRDHLHGYGIFDLARGAYDFLEREKIQGNMFNTYGIGGYLIYRGYPDRKVFIDGRNVDYGYNYLLGTYLAGREPTRWQELEETFNVTYALIDYDAIKETDYLPYVTHLKNNPRWQMVYLDDWVAVYLKDVPQNRTIIERLRYRIVNPENFEFGMVLDTASTTENNLLLEQELQRVAASNPNSIKGRVLLARFYLRQNRPDEARKYTEEASAAQPYRPVPHELLGMIEINKGNWEEAGRHFEKMLRLAGDAYPDINYNYIGDVFAQAGAMNKAQYYYRKARREQPPASSGVWHALTSSVAPTAPSPPPATNDQAKQLLQELQTNVADDTVRYNNQGVDYAQKGNYTKAREEFLKALTVTPRHPEALNNMGSTYQYEKNWEKAIEFYQRAVAEKPDYSDAYYNLAVAYYSAGRYREAWEAAQKADLKTWFNQKLLDDIRRAAETVR